MSRCCRIFTLLAALLFMGSVAWAQSSGSFNYGKGAGTTACVLNTTNPGVITGGVPCPGQANTCTSNSDCTAANSTCYNPTGGAGTGVCVQSSTNTTFCSTDSDCSSITNASCIGAGATCSTDTDCGLSLNCVSGTCSGICEITCTGSTCGTGAGCIGDVEIGIKTSSGNGNVFLVRPSAVIGLLTDVTLTSKQISSASGSVTSGAFAGVDFAVSVDSAPKGSTPTLTPSGSITYDSRFIQISTNLFKGLSADCTALTGGCFFTFNESTVAAHSFDWVISGLVSGNYVVEATWTSSLGDFGISSSMTCVGPVVLTVQQNKIFTPSTKISTVSF